MRRRLRSHLAGDVVSAERLRRLRHDRQCLGVDLGLVVGEARAGCAKGVLRPGKSARRSRDGELRPLPAANQDSPQGHQRRLASVRAELLPPLPPGRAPRGSGGYVHQPSRVSVCQQKRERSMPNGDNGDKSNLKNSALNRRNILLGGTTLAAASAIVAGNRVAQAQAQPAAPPSGKKPNILVIFGDDIGQTNISAYAFGVVGYKTPNIDRIAKEGMMFTDYYAENSCTAGRSAFRRATSR